MAKAKSLVGLDVHATKIVAAVLDALARLLLAGSFTRSGCRGQRRRRCVTWSVSGSRCGSI